MLMSHLLKEAQGLPTSFQGCLRPWLRHPCSGGNLPCWVLISPAEKGRQGDSLPGTCLPLGSQETLGDIGTTTG